MRYEHWFWNSWFMDKVEDLLVYSMNYVWEKKYARR
jgi:hypothetical protein